jgi:2-C-methyl-D-erythritol 4-phosphate cytidylyltransferase
VSVRAAVVIPAAGAGRRMGGEAKAFLALAGEPMLLHTLRPFLAESRVVRVVIALDAVSAAAPPTWLTALDERVTVVAGGATRGESVAGALAAIDADVDVVLIHDAARPFVTAAVIDRAIRAAAAGESVIAAVPVTDTIQQVNGEGRITGTPERHSLWHAQTPQAFPRHVVIDAYRAARADGFTATDDAAVIARYGTVVRVIEGTRENFKVTTPTDVLVAEALLSRS